MNLCGPPGLHARDRRESHAAEEAGEASARRVVVRRDRGLEPGKVPGRKLPNRIRENGNSGGCFERLTDRAWIVEGEEQHALRVVFLIAGEVVLDRGFLGE